MSAASYGSYFFTNRNLDARQDMGAVLKANATEKDRQRNRRVEILIEYRNK